jgi:prepilin-type N-terminal cleavage/methylation domain-containing protein
MQKLDRAGFTLLELMAVMLIMFMLMGMATVSMRGLMRGSGFSGAVTNVRSVMTQARQFSIMRGVPVRVEFTVNSMDMLQLPVGTGVQHRIAEVRYLPTGINFDGIPGPVEFNPDGTPRNTSGYPIPIKELYVAGSSIVTLQVDGMTGWIH